MTAPRRAAAVAAAILALTVAAGCADDDAAGGASTPTPTATVAAGDQRLADPAAGAMIAGPAGPNVADLLADTTGEPIVGAGHLFVDADGAARLCEAMAESFPPRCGGRSIPVTNLPPEVVDGLETKDGVRWSEEPVQLIGRVKNGTFVNDPELLAAS